MSVKLSYNLHIVLDPETENRIIHFIHDQNHPLTADYIQYLIQEGLAYHRQRRK